MFSLVAGENIDSQHYKLDSLDNSTKPKLNRSGKGSLLLNFQEQSSKFSRFHCSSGRVKCFSLGKFGSEAKSW